MEARRDIAENLVNFADIDYDMFVARISCLQERKRIIEKELDFVLVWRTLAH